ncbi:hypothetical protein K438DRAFT_1787353 [Mycena galopus ATCC 62051]|nr:hypothetical protein K438DRAFT_1787353 [Mycena galopus ATCC 62051]
MKTSGRVLPPTPFRCAAEPSAESGAGPGAEPGAGPGAGPNGKTLFDMDIEGLIDLVRRVVIDIWQEKEAASIKRGSSGGRRAPSKRSRDIKAQQAMMPTEQDLWWKDAVRRVWRERYGVTVAADFARHTPAAENLVQQCRSGSHGPAANEWALDFGYGYLTSLWNKAILDRFTDSVQGAHHESADGWGLPKVGRDYIFGLFQNQLKQAQEEWKKCQPRSSDTGDLETEEETACRLETTQQRRLRKKASNATKTRVSHHISTMWLKPDRAQKYQRRLKCTEVLIELEEGKDAESSRTWLHMKDMLERLGKDGMSSEEEGHRDKGTHVDDVYYVKLCAWRAKPITEYLQHLDEKARELQIAGRATPRVRDELHGDSAAPPVAGLPEKMYDEQWLAQKSDFYVEEKLRVSQEAFELLVRLDKGKGRLEMDDDDDV